MYYAYFNFIQKEKQHKGRTNYATVDILTCIRKKGGKKIII